MKFHRLKIKDLILIKPEIYDDDRGFFMSLIIKLNLMSLLD